MSDKSLNKLQLAAKEAWQSCWHTLNRSHDKLHLECEEFNDRIELTFRCSGSAAEMEAHAAQLKPKVDQVTVETHSGKPQLKLIAYANRH
jgi:hypothetical protein